MALPPSSAMMRAVAIRVIKVLDAASLARRNVVVLELDTPNPITGIAIGMTVTLVTRDGSKTKLELKGLGFASSTPDHAHIIVSSPPQEMDLSSVDRIEVETRA